MLDNPTLIDLEPLTIDVGKRNIRLNFRQRPRHIKVKLSPRECQIMQMLADGLTVEFVAYQLGISKGVARLYTNSARRKLDAPSTVCAVAKCVQLGLVHANVWIFLEE